MKPGSHIAIHGFCVYPINECLHDTKYATNNFYQIQDTSVITMTRLWGWVTRA
jgi:hypothetical protein